MRTLALSLLVASLAGCQAPEAEISVGEADQAVVVCPGASKVQGVDVSYYQGTIDWAKVKASGRGFAIARVSDGTFQDPKFAANWSGIKAAGMVRGAYHFFRAGDDPITIADQFLAKIGTLKDGDLPPVLDVEVTDGQSVSTVVSRMKTWLAHVEQKSGRVPIIYTAPGFWSQLGNPDLSHYTLWVANWQVSCPNTPGGWKSWRLWQYADDGTVPGISGRVDVDEFNGTLADLQKLAAAPNTAPRGYLDAADCTSLRGWAQDPNTATKPIDVKVTFDGTDGEKGVTEVALTADVKRQDLCTALGSCDHGWEMPTPRALLDGTAHKVYAYAVDATAGTTTLLKDAPKTFTCAPPEPSIAATDGVKRWIPSGAVLDAWKLSRLYDLAHEPDAVVDAYENGADLPAKPEVVQADDGTAEIWVVDGTMRRRVQSPASLKAWAFTAAKTKAATVYGYNQGPDWPAEPFLIQGSGARVYVLDAKEAGVVGGDNNGGATVGGGDPGGDNGAGTSSGGCSLSGHDAPASSGLLFLLLVVALGIRRRAF